MLKGKKIIIGITASIAAYKIPLLIRLLKKSGAEVQVIITPFAAKFVTPLTLSTLSENAVLVDFFDEGSGSWNSHVDLGLWADLLLVAPLSANTMAKMANGSADNLLLTTILSARCPVLFAPAMDLDMYQHPTTQENIIKLQSFGYQLIDPVEGELASGLKGMGRLEEPDKIFETIRDFFDTNNSFEGKKVLVTAGPTYEPIDPVRFIGNHSSGKMGVEIALEIAKRGADVELVLGPSSIEINEPAIRIHRVATAESMLLACDDLFDNCDICIMSAAVADFTPSDPARAKIKKNNTIDSISVKPTVDILSKLGAKKSEDQLLVGFALETNNEEANALDKLKRKNLDFIVLNSLNDEGAGFFHETNKVSVFSSDGIKIEFPLKSKKEVACDILNLIEKSL